MSKLSKKLKESTSKIDKNQFYTVDQASGLVKEISNLKFDASVDIAVKLGVDPRQANQMVRGVVTLPHGTGNIVLPTILGIFDDFYLHDGMVRGDTLWGRLCIRVEV